MEGALNSTREAAYSEQIVNVLRQIEVAIANRNPNRIAMCGYPGIRLGRCGGDECRARFPRRADPG